ncbi:hypothetical protein B808_1121 [Fructilactobacillus florum 8D]|uniref:Phage conserved hypothetical protein C-terminal domain-containing protein n=1 Tax=Fructilactobacillus florum 8D TaxID=1221538 RepID=W9ED69_9LACO|nr:conserved phage C-terminal domain-containing protein [Fructilactobacillus florum]ETO40012.1 hypothetical protein B808_1121 [Fructilactobacillus florum 8D]
MTKINRNRESTFTSADNKLVRDERLSWKARGIFIYLFSQSENWEFYETEVMNHATDGRTSLRSGLAELEKYGYLVRKQLKNDKGKFSGWEWIIDDIPMLQKPKLQNVTSENETLRTNNKRTNNTSNTNSKREALSSSDEPDAVSTKNQPTEKTDCQIIIDYLNAETGKHYLNTSANRRLIEARFKDGFTVSDFKTVIDNQSFAWSRDRKMSQYLRPATLFQASKFEGYLNNIPTINNGREEDLHDEELGF